MPSRRFTVTLPTALPCQRQTRFIDASRLELAPLRENPSTGLDVLPATEKSRKRLAFEA